MVEIWSPELLAGAIEQAALAVLVADATGVITYANPRLTGMTGYTVDELVGMNIAELNDDWLHQQEAVWSVVAQGDAWSGRIRARGKDGERFYAQAWISPVRAPCGTITHFIGISETARKRKRFEDGGQRREHGGRRSVDDYVSVVDRDGTILYLNHTIPGRTREQTVGTNIYDYVLPEQRQRLCAALTHVFEKGQPTRGELIPGEPMGETSSFNTSVGPILHGRKVVAAAISSRDARHSPLPEGTERLQTVVPPRDAPPGGCVPDLSQRELDVLVLLARGLTNRDIASSLVISKRTVDCHVSHILGKLRVPNRTAAVVAAEQEGYL